MTLYTVIFLLAAVGVGCNGSDDVGSFTIERESSEKTVEGGPTGNLGKLGEASPFSNPFTFNIDLQRELAKRDADGASGVYFESLKFTVTDQDDNFDFLNKVVFDADADGESRTEIARKDPVPEGVKEFDFDTESQVNLKPYIEKGMNLKTTVEGKRPTEDRSFKAIITLRVETL